MGRRHAVTEISPLSAFSHTFTVHEEQMNLTDFKNTLLEFRSNKNEGSDNVKYICPMPNCDKLFLIKEELQFHIDCRHKSVDENDLFCTEVPDMFEDEEEILPTFEKINKKKTKRFSRLQEVAIQLYSELDIEKRCFVSKKKLVPFESGCLKIVNNKKNCLLQENNNPKNSQKISPKRKINQTIPSDLLLTFERKKPKCSKLIDIVKAKNSEIFNMVSPVENIEYLDKIIKYQYSNNEKLPYIIDLLDSTIKNCTLPGLCSTNTSYTAIDVLKNNYDMNKNCGNKQESLGKRNTKDCDIIELENSLKNEDDYSKLFGMNVKLSKNYCDSVFKIASNFILNLSTSPEKIFNPSDNFRIII